MTVIGEKAVRGGGKKQSYPGVLIQGPSRLLELSPHSACYASVAIDHSSSSEGSKHCTLPGHEHAGALPSSKIPPPFPTPRVSPRHPSLVARQKVGRRIPAQRLSC